MLMCTILQSGQSLPCDVTYNVTSIGGAQVCTARSFRTTFASASSSTFSELMQCMMMCTESETLMKQRSVQEREELEEMSEQEKDEVKEGTGVMSI